MGAGVFRLRRRGEKAGHLRSAGDGRRAAPGADLEHELRRPGALLRNFGVAKPGCRSLTTSAAGDFYPPRQARSLLFHEARFPSSLFCLLFSCPVARAARTARGAERELSSPGAVQRVRTTAYTFTEAGGRHNACGGIPELRRRSTARRRIGRVTPSARGSRSSRRARSARSTITARRWSARTRSTSTRTRARQMTRWGVRMVHIQILEWGSPRAEPGNPGPARAQLPTCGPWWPRCGSRPRARRRRFHARSCTA